MFVQKGRFKTDYVPTICTTGEFEYVSIYFEIHNHNVHSQFV